MAKMSEIQAQEVVNRIDALINQVNVEMKDLVKAGYRPEVDVTETGRVKGAVAMGDPMSPYIIITVWKNLSL